MTTQATENERFLTPGQLRERWQISRQTFNVWRKAGKLPPSIKIGALYRFRLEDVIAFEYSNRI